MSPLDETNNNFDHPFYYTNRELSWLAFNKRVYQEAVDETNPLLERLKFLAICSSNLDEFFMVRVAGLKDQVKLGYNGADKKSGLTPKQQLEQIAVCNHQLVEKQYQQYRLLQADLGQENIAIRSIESLSKQEKQNIEIYFDEYIYPVLTPMAIDRYRPFPMLMNKSINIAVLLKNKDKSLEVDVKTAIVQVPALLGRYVQLNKNHHYILVEDLICHFIGKLFKGYDVRSITAFRITRNADLSIREEGAQDLLTEVETQLKKRKRGNAIRLEVQKQKKDEEIIKFLLRTLDLEANDLYSIDGPLDLTFLFSFHKNLAKEKEHLVYKSLVPKHPQDIARGENIFDASRNRDLFIHHPYESFEPIIDLVNKAADDSNVLAIKQTLYRVSGDSPIIEGLKRAAENGKQVTVLVELKARFDEEQNVHWAKELERAGCHVIYGIDHLKTHSKIILIVRKNNEKVERFVHLGTGNYNDQTANQYTDMSLITTERKFGIDATNFFNYVSGYMKKPNFHYISISPYDIRMDFIKLVDQEISSHQQHGNGRIIAKMNALTDKILIKKMYQASQAGVKIDLIVRGICCLQSGIEGVSENITVTSIVGRYLEHSRVYYFHHNGDDKVFLSSADLMTRNMVRRLEILFPILDNTIKDRIKHVLTIILSDNVKARRLSSDGFYDYVSSSKANEKVNSQLTLYRISGRQDLN